MDVRSLKVVLLCIDVSLTNIKGFEELVHAALGEGLNEGPPGLKYGPIDECEEL